MARPAPWLHPNVITTLRLPIAPVAVAFLVWGTLWGTIIAAVLALLLELSDLADGYIARKYNIVSDFGKLFDPFSDAFCRYTLFLGLYAIGIADLWMVLAIFYRDSAISFFRSVAGVRNVVLSARPSGKVKAWIQGVGIQVIFLCLVLKHLTASPWIDSIPWWTMLIVTVSTLFSFVDYFVGNLPLLSDAWYNRPVDGEDSKGA